MRGSLDWTGSFSSSRTDGPSYSMNFDEATEGGCLKESNDGSRSLHALRLQMSLCPLALLARRPRVAMLHRGLSVRMQPCDHATEPIIHNPLPLSLRALSLARPIPACPIAQHHLVDDVDDVVGQGCDTCDAISLSRSFHHIAFLRCPFSFSIAFAFV